MAAYHSQGCVSSSRSESNSSVVFMLDESLSLKVVYHIAGSSHCDCEAMAQVARLGCSISSFQVPDGFEVFLFYGCQVLGQTDSG